MVKIKEVEGITEAEFEMFAEKKDACYHKVKARYKVWPSAYASGALVQCVVKRVRPTGVTKARNEDKRTERITRQRICESSQRRYRETKTEVSA